MLKDLILLLIQTMHTRKEMKLKHLAYRLTLRVIQQQRLQIILTQRVVALLHMAEELIQKDIVLQLVDQKHMLRVIIQLLLEKIHTQKEITEKRMVMRPTLKAMVV